MRSFFFADNLKILSKKTRNTGCKVGQTPN